LKTVVVIVFTTTRLFSSPSGSLPQVPEPIRHLTDIPAIKHKNFFFVSFHQEDGMREGQQTFQSQGRVPSVLQSQAWASS